ncbi:MAG TPA: response regulator [Bacteroidia bacterium]|nr:response regulator [Bacteroidia bacterium]
MNVQPPYNHILLLDDTDVDLFISKKIFEAANFARDIQTFQSGNTAIQDLITKNKEGRSWPELFFIDIRMPEMDGFEFIKMVTDILPENNRSKFILITAELSDDIKRTAGKNKNVFKILRKPFSIEDLDSLLAE